MTRGMIALALCIAGCGTEPEPHCELPDGLPVFPGAEGFGTDTPAGRGGAILEVTTLADSGPGSLRDAIETAGPRTIVFRVGGTIDAGSHLEIHEPNLTIAGQTAPGDGILIRGAGIVVFASDVLIQHVRIRPGSSSPVDPEDNDALAILGARRVVIDHVSASWSEDEVLSVWEGARDVTIAWSIVSEGLDRARHEKGGHSAGLLLANQSSCTSVHGVLMAHNGFRNPLAQGGGRHDVVNNVIYDWGELGTEVVPLAHVIEVNLIGNTYVPGPSTERALRAAVVGGNHPVNHFGNGRALLSPAGQARLHVLGNRAPRRPTDDADEWAFVSDGYGDEDAPEDVRFGAPFEAAPVAALPADAAFESVLAEAGATAPRRDAVDARVVDEVRTGGGRIVDRVEDVGGYPAMTGGDPPPDTDHDGMPDEWETMRGLSSTDPSDGADDDDGDGYTNVEEYLHSLSP